MTESTDDARIERMFAEGKLTADEAERLRGSLAAHAERETPLRAADSPRERRRLWLLIASLMAFFLLGAATHWLLSDFATFAPIAGAEPTTSAVPAGRLINLSGLSEERSTTMKRSLPLSFSIVTISVLAVRIPAKVTGHSGERDRFAHRRGAGAFFFIVIGHDQSRAKWCMHGNYPVWG